MIFICQKTTRAHLHRSTRKMPEFRKIRKKVKIIFLLPCRDTHYSLLGCVLASVVAMEKRPPFRPHHSKYAAHPAIHFGRERIAALHDGPEDLLAELGLLRRFSENSISNSRLFGPAVSVSFEIHGRPALRGTATRHSGILCSF